MIKVNNVVKTFEGFRALDGLTMTAEKGSIYGLVGPNGAGKSTILRHIIGIYRPDSGSVLVDAFWLALCFQPEVLVLDEPVDGLDPVMRRQVWSLLMGDVAQRGTTVLVSSHNLRELEDVCDHVGILSHGKVLLERSLTDLQDNVVKLQVAFQDGQLPQLPQDMNVLHTTQVGRVFTLIVRGSPADIKTRMAVYSPILMEALPLSLEEIFIYEMGGEDYGVRDIVL